MFSAYHENAPIFLFFIKTPLSDFQTISTQLHSRFFDIEAPTPVPQKHRMKLYMLGFCRTEIGCS